MNEETAEIKELAKNRFLKDIRKRVIENPEMTVDEKIILCTVIFLSSSRGFCWVSNVTLARTLDLEVTEINEILTKLCDNKLLYMEQKGPSRRLWIYEEYVGSVKKEKKN